MKTRYSFSAKEARLLRLKLNTPGGDGEYLEPLGGFQRTKESTLGAGRNLLGGAGQVITGKNGRVRGLLRIGEGFLDFGDALTSPIPDGIRSVSGMPTGNARPGRLNISRAALDYRNIRVDDPVNTIKDTAAYTAGLAHAVLFKPGSDLIRLGRRFSNN